MNSPTASTPKKQPLPFFVAAVAKANTFNKKHLFSEFLIFQQVLQKPKEFSSLLLRHHRKFL